MGIINLAYDCCLFHFRYGPNCTRSAEASSRPWSIVLLATLDLLHPVCMSQCSSRTVGSVHVSARSGRLATPDLLVYRLSLLSLLDSIDVRSLRHLL